MALQHQVFQGPFEVVLDRVQVDKPTNYSHYYQDPPLPAKINAWKVHEEIFDASGKKVFGSVTVDSGLADSPDAELISSGINTKGPNWASIGRHGNFLMWGFAAPPSKLTKSGSQVLSNCVAYISKFDHEQPRSLQKYIGRDWWIDTAVQLRDVKTEFERLKKLQEGQPNFPEQLRVTTLAKFVEKTAKREFPDLWASLGTDIEAYLPAMLANRDYLYARGHRFKAPRIDKDAKAFDIANHSPKLLEHCIASLLLGKDQERAQRVLERYTGLSLKTGAAWRDWYAGVKDGIYFSDTGGYQFFSATPSVAELAAQAVQGPASETDYESPVAFTGLLVPDPGKSTSATLVVRIDLLRGWHIYKQAKNTPYQATRLKALLPKGVRTVGEWRRPTAYPYRDRDGVTIWEGQAVFQQRVVADTPAMLASGAAVAVTYQACDRTGCRPPKTVEVDCLLRSNDSK